MHVMLKKPICDFYSNCSVVYDFDDRHLRQRVLQRRLVLDYLVRPTSRKALVLLGMPEPFGLLRRVV